MSPVSAIGYNGRDLQIPHGEESAALMGRQGGKSVAELVRDKILDIQVRWEENYLLWALLQSSISGGRDMPYSYENV